MELDEITRNGYATTRTLNNEAVAGVQRRSNRRVLDTLMETQDAHARLLREQHELQRQNDLAVQLIRTLADRSEAFRRLAVHLRDAWEPTNPAELSLKKSLAPLLDQKEHELAMDGEWAKQRDAGIAAHLCAPTAKTSVKR